MSRGDAYLINYTKKNVLIISFILTLCIFCIIEVSYSKAKSIYFDFKSKKNIIVEKDNNEKNKKEYKKTEEIIKYKDLDENIWQIEIPKISLVAPIKNGTTQEIMNKYVGHFENTDRWNGNIGLAAHNRRISN
ncbi:MAG: hypothetical protein Q4G09_01600 [Clostridia bacterium]|nr:hypothetical protein [Clostridia bacterium]